MGIFDIFTFISHDPPPAAFEYRIEAADSFVLAVGAGGAVAGLHRLDVNLARGKIAAKLCHFLGNGLGQRCKLRLAEQGIAAGGADTVLAVSQRQDL